MWEQLKKLFLKAIWIAGLIVADALVLTVAVLCISWMEFLVGRTVDSEKLWLGMVYPPYVFQLLDLAAIGTVGFHSIMRIWKGGFDD